MPRLPHQRHHLRPQRQRLLPGLRKRSDHPQPRHRGTTEHKRPHPHSLDTIRLRKRPHGLPRKLHHLRPPGQRLLPAIPKGAIIWSPSTGAQLSTNGPIRTAWAASGYEHGPWATPPATYSAAYATAAASRLTKRRNPLVPTTGAHISRTGAIRLLYRNNSAENGTLGYPTSAEVCGLTNNGCYQNYQNGAIIWSPTTGAQTSPNGPIRTAWQQTGYETGRLGYPTSPVVCGLTNNGCYQNYQNGAIIWSPTTGAQTSLNGPIRTLWQQTGYETGRLGYPTSPQTCNQTADTCTQQFTGGKITWTPTRGAYMG
ncbi:LGFP repeat-containing protein [Arthrobacter sp. SA17]